MSKVKKTRSVTSGDGRSRRSTRKAARRRAGPTPSTAQRPMKTSHHEGEDRIAWARQRINEGFYDRDDVRRAIAEALVFVLSARRD